jgi:hypothetical protein
MVRVFGGRRCGWALAGFAVDAETGRPSVDGWLVTGRMKAFTVVSSISLLGCQLHPGEGA